MLGLLTNLTTNATIVSEFSQISYTIRNLMRISGEHVGLTQSVPNDRKGDYLFRDYFLTNGNMFVYNTGYRLIDDLYTQPMQVKILGLDNLQKIYENSPLHRPLLPSFFQPQNGRKLLPSYVSQYLTGYNINPRTYSIAPDLIDSMMLPELANKGESLQTINQAKLVTHHLRRIFNPASYIDTFLLKNGRVTQTEADILKQQLGVLDKFSHLFEEAQNKGAFKPLQDMLKTYAKMPELKHRNWLQQISRLSHDDLKLLIQGPTIREMMAGKSLPRRLMSFINREDKHKTLLLDDLLIRVRQNILKPLVIAKSHGGEKLLALLKEFTHSRIRTNQAISIAEATSSWLKLPMGIALITLYQGLMGGYLDVRYVQPFQDQVNKLRGDSTELQLPTYLGAIPGVILAALVIRSRTVQKMGSAAAWGLGTIAYHIGHMGSTWIGFKHQMDKPRLKHEKLEVLKVPKEAVDQLAKTAKPATELTTHKSNYHYNPYYNAALTPYQPVRL